MSYIVRLQGLPAVADSYDIRQFFCALNIPKGGVYITGGKYGEAYIVFATYQDAQYALGLNGRLLRDSCVHLAYSNEEEMKRAMEVYQIDLNPSTSSSNNLSSSPEKKDLPTCSYLSIRGQSFKATRRDIEEFFKGLDVLDVLHVRTCMNVYRSRKAIVKFGKKTDASEAVKLHMQSLCGSPVILRMSDEDEWKYYSADSVAKRQKSQSHSSSREKHQSRSRSPVRRSTRSGSPSVQQYYLHLINLSYTAEKRDIKKFFHDSTMEDSQITFLVDIEGRKTREGFVMFKSKKDYNRACSLDGSSLMGRSISILPIYKKDMQDLIDRMKVRVCKNRTESPTRNSRERRYLYLRNFVSEVSKTDVQKFFTGLTVKEDDIYLLHDSKGIGLGEVLVTFSDEKDASKAERNNKETHLGIKILLSRVTAVQVKALKEDNQVHNPIVSEDDNRPDSTSDSLPSMSTTIVKMPSVQTKEDSLAPDSSHIETCSGLEGLMDSNVESEPTSRLDFLHSLLNRSVLTQQCPDF